MLQVICNCGRIAEVRHRSNGAKLAYQYCNHCKGGVVSKAAAADIEARAKEDIGTFGEFFEKKETPLLNKPEKTTNQGQSDFVPSPEDKPEVLESNSINNCDSPGELLNEQSAAKPNKTPKLLKILGCILFTGVLGAGAYQLNKNRG